LSTISSETGDDQHLDWRQAPATAILADFSVQAGA